MSQITIKTSIQKYPAYKDSGVDWLGEIPEGWDAVRMKFLFRDVSVKNKPEEELLSVTQDKGVVPRTWVENRMVMPSGNLESFKYIQRGNFAISLRSFEGGLEYCHHDGIISPAYTVLKKKNGLVDTFYKYLFKSFSFISEIQTSVVGIREGKNISYPELSYSLLPIPSPSEQTAIANFLDDKTAKIDQAIAQKEQLIALLKERKQIIIQNAVTGKVVWSENKQKMIPLAQSEVERKDSGVEWIGEIPEHWEVKKITHLFEKIGSGTTPTSGDKRYYDGKYNFLQTGDLNDGKIFSTKKTLKQKAFKDFSSLKKYPIGSLVMAMYGATIGKLGILETVSATNQACCVFEKPKGILVEYFFFILLAFRLEIISFGYGGGQPNISQDLIKSLRFPIPDVSQQSQIISRIKTQSFKIDQVISSQQSQIQKLKEYKSTLIDNAVTGKIKVS